MADIVKRQWERKELVSSTDMKSIRLTDSSKYDILNMTLYASVHNGKKGHNAGNKGMLCNGNNRISAAWS